jgi:hypothetical protein
MTIEAPARPDQTTRELEALMEEARRRARRRRFGYAAGAAAALLLAIVGVLLIGGGEGADHARDEANSRSSAAAEPRDVLFVRAVVDSQGVVAIDEGVFAIDISTGEVKRLRVRASCGDTPFCLISTGGELVISSVGRTTTYNPAAPGRAGAARLGNGWITIPSTDDGHVWLGILARGKLGGPHRRGLSALREIDLDGNVVQTMRPPQGMWPVGAVESGLLFQYGRSLRLWSLEERGFTIRIPGAFPAATFANLVASRGDHGSEFLLTDTRTGEIARIAPPAGYRWIGSQGVFTPNGSHLALSLASVGEGPRFSRTETLAVVDMRTLDARVIPDSTEVDPTYAPMAWSSKGDRLFFVGDDGTVMSYRVGSDSLTAHAKFDSNDRILQMVSVRRRD